jgi:hypothetical protein
MSSDAVVYTFGCAADSSMTITLSELLVWAAIIAAAFFAAGVIVEYCTAAIHHGHQQHHEGDK